MWLRLLTRLAAWVFFIHSACFAQPADRRHLQAVLQEKQSKKDFFKDTTFIDALNQMASSYYSISADSLFRYAARALDYAKKTGYQRGESVALRQMGNGYKLKGDFTNMLTYYLQSLVIAERINDPGLMGKACLNIALQYIDMHKNDDAMYMAMRAKRYLEATGDSVNINKCLAAAGEVWFNRLQYDSAMNYFQQAYRIAENLKDTYLLVNTNDEVATVLIMKGRYKEALSIYLRALAYYRHVGDETREAVAARDVALSYLKLKQYRKVLHYAHISWRISAQRKTITEMQTVSGMLADAYKGIGDYRKAFEYKSRYISLTDTIYNQQMQTNTARLAVRYEYEKKEVLLKEEQSKKDIRHNAIVRTQQLTIAFSIAVIIILSVLAHVLFRSRMSKQKANLALEAKNAEISRQKEEIEYQSLQLLLNNQQKDKLFSIIAHDLKAPLQSLKLTLDLLKAKALSDRQINRMMEELMQDADYSARLVGNLLSWATSQLKGIEVAPVELPLRQLTFDVLAQSWKQITDKKIELNVELSPGQTAWADSDMMLLVMRNLLSNAIKFCRPGDTITVTGQRSGKAIEICVADTGIGIKGDILEKIKERRIITTYGTAREKGTGLGMLLCREFIELNHGRFRVESEWEQGTRCFFTLPLLPLGEKNTRQVAV